MPVITYVLPTSYIANEWCAAADCTNPKATTNPSAALATPRFIATIPSSVRSQPESSRLLTRPLHAFLVIALPDLRPRPPINVRHAVLGDLTRRHRRRVAVDGKALRHALHDHERVAFAVVALFVEVVHDAHGLDERFRIVQHDLLLDAQERAGRVLARRIDLDRLHPVAELERAVRGPALNVRRTGDQGLAVPEADRLAEPLRHIGPEPRHDAALVELTADVDLRDQGLPGLAHVEHQVRRHDEAHVAAAAVLREAAHEPFGPAVRAGPLRGVAARVVIHLLHEALLILRRQQREIRRDLQDGAVVPRRRLLALPSIPAVPVGQRCLRVDGRPALALGLGEQRRVVLLRRLERVRAHDLLARVIAVAESPGCRARRIVSDQRHLVGAPDLLEADRRVAAVIARVEPEIAVLVEVLRRENVVRQRLDAGRNGAVLRREDRRVALGDAGTDEQALAFGADDHRGSKRIPSAAARARLRTGSGACERRGGCDAEPEFPVAEPN